MANTLWFNSAINTNIAAQTFNQLYSMKAIPIVRRKNGFLYAILGKMEQGSDLPGVSFERLNPITGNQIEVKLMGQLDSIATVADGSAELAVGTPTYDPNTWGAALFDLTHYYLIKGIPSSEYNRIAGSEAKTAKFIDDVFEHQMLSLENQIGTDMNGTGGGGIAAPARTQLGTWPYAVSDGVSAGETAYATYGQIDRSQSANSAYRANVLPNVGDLTLNKVRTIKNTNTTYGGASDVAIAEPTVYGKMQLILEAYTTTSDDPDWTQFGGEYVQYGGTKYILDQRSPTGTMGVFDSSSWAWWQNMINFTQDCFVRLPNAPGGYVLSWECWCQLICLSPNRNGKITGITA